MLDNHRDSQVPSRRHDLHEDRESTRQGNPVGKLSGEKNSETKEERKAEGTKMVGENGAFQGSIKR